MACGDQRHSTSGCWAGHPAQSSQYVCWVPRQCQVGSWAGLCAAKPRRPIGPPGSGLGLLLGLGAAALRLGAYPVVGTLSVFVAGWLPCSAQV